MQRLLHALIVAVHWLAGTDAQAQQPLQQLYEKQQWFELRDSLRGQEAPPLYRAAVASAFNRTEEAERELSRLRGAADATTMSAATEELLGLYMRTGRFGDALKVTEDILSRSPERADVRNLRALLAGADARNQRLVSSTQATFACSVGAGDGEGVRMPLSVNGVTVRWELDTGFNLPGLSEAEARMLGIVVGETVGTAVDGAGGSAGIRFAVADRVTIGGTELRDVLMGVFPDSQPPWNEWPPGQRGLIGLPLALPLQSIRWTSDGTCRTGPRSGPVRDAEENLAFHGSAPEVRATFGGRSLTLYLDTGNMRQSQLFSRFAADFADIVAQQGTKGRVSLNQIGSSSEHEVIVLPEVRMRVGGFDTLLRPANIFSPPVSDTRSHGNLGMDLLSQASDVTIDFESMMLSLR
jgi:hypothetical protein